MIKLIIFVFKFFLFLSLRVCLQADEAIPMLVVLRGLLRHYIPRKDVAIPVFCKSSMKHFNYTTITKNFKDIP